MADLEQFPLKKNKILLVVPPFGDLYQPCLGVHILQACAGKAGFDVSVLYGNHLLAYQIGPDVYRGIVTDSKRCLIQERIFSGKAFGVAPMTEEEKVLSRLDALRDIPAMVDLWLEEMYPLVAACDADIVGCTTTFEQTSAGAALLNYCKQRNPALVTIIGGANCEGEMAEGILSLGGSIDYVFSGESEASFISFLKDMADGDRPETRIFAGAPYLNLDQMPKPDFGEFFQQRLFLFPDSESEEWPAIMIPYESSRGCWWGQKHHCTFCGLNGMGMAFREKSAAKVIAELNQLYREHPYASVNMVDNIMPHSYFKTLLPRAAELPESISVFFEQKANITLEKAIALKKANIDRIQPGIESMSSSLLRRMDKGIKAHQNIALLRYGRALGIHIIWNLLVRFPGDEESDYREMLELIPQLVHLRPPEGAHKVCYDRFSPYFMNPEKYGVHNLRPRVQYASVYPPHADLYKLSYHFDADVDSALDRDPALAEAIDEACKAWIAAWENEHEEMVPLLRVSRLFDDEYVLIDTRALAGGEQQTFLDREEAATVLNGRGLHERNKVARALKNKWVAELDGRFVPLAVAPQDLMVEFEQENKGVAQDQEKMAI